MEEPIRWGGRGVETWKILLSRWGQFLLLCDYLNVRGADTSKQIAGKPFRAAISSVVRILCVSFRLHHDLIKNFVLKSCREEKRETRRKLTRHFMTRFNIMQPMPLLSTLSQLSRKTKTEIASRDMLYNKRLKDPLTKAAAGSRDYSNEDS